MNLSKSAIDREKDTLRKMIKLYCRKQRHHGDTPCKDCVALLNYACRRLDLCKFGAAKPTCENCPLHCYKPDQRERIKRIMRYAGPRMIIYHPLDAVRHFIKNKRRTPVN